MKSYARGKLNRCCIAFFALLLSMRHSAHAEELLTVGIMTELSGPSAPNGENCRRGYDLALKDFAHGGKVGGFTLNLVWADTQGDAKTGVSEFKRLVDIAGAGVVLFNRSQIGMALNPLSKDRKIPVIGVVGHPDFTKDNPYAFRFWPPCEEEAMAHARRAAALGFKTGAILTAEEQWTLAVRRTFLAEFGRSGSIDYDQVLPPEELDFSAAAARIRSLKPDFVLINLALGQSGAAIKKLRQAGIDAPLFGTYFASVPSELKTAGGAAEGLLLMEIDFRTAGFLARFGRLEPPAEPSAISYVCYCALAALCQTLRSMGGSFDRELFHRTMLEQSKIMLPDGPVSLINREMHFKLRKAVVRDGAIAGSPD